MDHDFLLGTPLFSGMTEAELENALRALDARTRDYQKGDLICHAGDTTGSIALILSGSVTIENNDYLGNRTILNTLGTGHLFAEAYALLEGEPLLVDVAAKENCRILFLRIGSIRTLQAFTGTWAVLLMANLLRILAHRSLALSGRSFHTAPKTIRGRVMSYLNAVSIRKGTREFDIPFDRQQLADYLGVERSALSKELGKMRRDGILQVRKNHFLILQ